ncbi:MULTISPECIES: MmgE/PrpD family protein [unclassified Beijerinckia]|uniref:MmgE/PrpD family protein n=1 Tax=unclassified Beijerinckia TaxID=2638183 RepID=UPI00089CF39C|nr:MULTISPECIES: MmgE/PrpD family protein [unclassified Beijerinckia]MDH7795886.1 2-methylcitrate dehydratase PrpD [Beijerinckia sp. GAS462]SEC20723.1 2-methylcitrate dehydratase PrpD [Beijerinckia sp. 28-YEA-48]
MLPDDAGHLIDFALRFELDQANDGARERARLIVLDTYGAMLAAASHPIGVIAHRQALRTQALNEASLAGHDQRTGMLEAAFANGILANAVDFDEGSHVATVALPAALAMAEKMSLSGKDFLTAFIVAFEIASRLREALAPALGQRGVWHIGHIGPLAAALCGAHLLGLDAQTARMALGIATAASAGYRRHLGTMTKALHSGHAARAGLEAALLARDGFTADADVFDANDGWLAALTTPQAPKREALRDLLAGPLVLDQPTKIKTMPVCTPIAPAIDAMITCAARHGIAASDIAHLAVDLKSGSLIRDRPIDLDAAPFSGRFLIALAAVRGAVSLDTLNHDTLVDQEIIHLMDRIDDAPGATSIKIALKDGRSFEAPLGPVRRLKARDEIVAKFRACAAPRWTEARIATFVDKALAIETLADINQLWSR